MKKTKSPITFIMLHKMLHRGSASLFCKQNSQNRTFLAQSGKRNFLMASLGLFGTLPFFQIFKAGKHENPYFFIASVRGGRVSELDAINFRNKEMLNALENKMFKEKKILKLRSVSLKDKISWVYVFDNRESYRKWDKAIKAMIRPTKQLPSKFQYFQSTGFLNSIKDKATVSI